MNASTASSSFSDLQHFVDRIVNSYVKWDLLTFFFGGTNSYSGLALAELSDTLGREGPALEEGLRDLIDAGYLESIPAQDATWYRATASESRRHEVRRFLNFVETREGRLKALYWLTRHRLQHPFKQ